MTLLKRSPRSPMPPVVSSYSFLSGPSRLSPTHNQDLPDIVATALTESNCLLPKGFIAKINDRGAVSLTRTDSHTPASSYAPYFDTIT